MLQGIWIDTIFPISGPVHYVKFWFSFSTMTCSLCQVLIFFLHYIFEGFFSFKPFLGCSGFWFVRVNQVVFLKYRSLGGPSCVFLSMVIFHSLYHQIILTLWRSTYLLYFKYLSLYPLGSPLLSLIIRISHTNNILTPISGQFTRSL